MNRQLVQYSLMRWVRKSEQQLTRKLLSESERANGVQVRFNLSALLRGNEADQVDVATKRLQAGLSTINEERALMDRPPVEDGDTTRVPVNTTPASAQPTAPPEPAPKATASAAPALSLDTFAELFHAAAARVPIGVALRCRWGPAFGAGPGGALEAARRQVAMRAGDEFALDRLELRTDAVPQ